MFIRASASIRDIRVIRGSNSVMLGSDLDAIVRDNLARVRERIARACAAAGRSPNEVTLVGVTKYVGPREAAALVRAGCRDLGESRPQQLWDKAESPELASAGVRWHMIGHMQRNKAARTLALAPLIHSVDSFRTLATINKAAEGTGAIAEYLFEVNCSGDPEKHGMPPAQLAQDVEECSQFFRNTKLLGLMTMAAREGDSDTALRNFSSLRELRDKVASRLCEGDSLDILSMGMSGDFQEAILEGSTMVRIGSALWKGLIN
jgi:pyridoxal phosphate enzyme (YggS family)